MHLTLRQSIDIINHICRVRYILTPDLKGASPSRKLVHSPLWAKGVEFEFINHHQAPFRETEKKMSFYLIVTINSNYS